MDRTIYRTLAVRTHKEVHALTSGSPQGGNLYIGLLFHCGVNSATVKFTRMTKRLIRRSQGYAAQP